MTPTLTTKTEVVLHLYLLEIKQPKEGLCIAFCHKQLRYNNAQVVEVSYGYKTSRAG